MSAKPAPPAELPKLLEQLKEVKNEAAELRTFTITFLSLLLYVNLIIAGTDAEQILRVAPVKLPLLDVPLPIIGFYGFLPWFLLFFHLYLLVQHYLFSQQLFGFDDTLQNASPMEQAHVRKHLGNLPFLQWMVGEHHSAMLVLLTLITLVCLIVWPLVTLLWLQMAILPYHSAELLAWQRTALVLDVLLVGWLWPKTLDRDDSSRAWWRKRMCDVWCSLSFVIRCLLWLICRIPGLSDGFATQPSSVWQKTVKSALPGAANALTLAAGLFATLFLSLAVATLPDSWEERVITGNVNSEDNKAPKPADSFWLKTVDVKEKNGEEEEDDASGHETVRMAFAPTAWLHEQHAKLFDVKDGQEKRQYDEWREKGAKPCPSAERPDKKAKLCLMVQPLLPRNLILREKVLTADAGLKPEIEVQLQAGVESPPKAEVLAQIRGLDLQNRNLDYADFTKSSLPKADLRYASLRQTMLRHARLDQVPALPTRLRQVDLSDAKLDPGTSLSSAELPGANLAAAKLPKADLRGAKLPGADLRGANLADADLTGADLSGADLRGANLANAKLSGAKLPDANLANVQLSGATLVGTKLPGANLAGAKLTGTDLFLAELPGADLSGAELTGADLSEAGLVGANLSKATLLGADLSKAVLSGTDLSNAELSGAILRIDALPLPEDKLRNAATLYGQALALRRGYQDKQWESAVKVFKQKVQQDIKLPKETPKICLRNADGETSLRGACIAENALDENSRKALADLWVGLACGDKTEGRWVAKHMVGRADPKRQPYSFPWFAAPLQQAAQDPKTCPGLAGLPEDYKIRLRQALRPQT